MNGFVLVTSGDQLRFTVDSDKDGKAEEKEPSASFTLEYKVSQ